MLGTDLLAPAALDAVGGLAPLGGIDAVVIVGIPVVVGLLGVHGCEQIGDGDVPGTAVDAVAAGRAGDEAHALEDGLHLLHRRQLRLIQRFEVPHERDVVLHLRHAAHAGQHHHHAFEARRKPQGVAGGTAAVEPVQHGLGLLRQVHQIAALHRLHDDDGLAVLPV